MDASLKPLIIVTAINREVLPSYTVANRTRSYAVSLEKLRAVSRRTRAIGDRLQNPSELTVTVFLQEATPAESFTAAYRLVELVEDATAVLYHEGAQAVSGLLGANVTADGLGARVTLRFAPSSAAFIPLLTVDTTAFTADTIDLRADATVNI
jgi:hypothetical protein